MIFSGTTQDLHAEARGALEVWSSWSVTRLIDVRENAVFEARSDRQEKAVLRLHRTGYQCLEAIASEMEWMNDLGRNGVRVPAPIRADKGEFLVETASGRIASLIAWIEGPLLADMAGREVGSRHLDRQIHLLGQQLAVIHDVADNFVLPNGFSRRSLNLNGLLGPYPVWGRFWDNPHLATADREFVVEMREMLVSRLAGLVDGRPDYGLIHADPLKENVIIEDGVPVLIDYDDCAFGYRVYDIAVALTSWIDNPHYSEIERQIRDGYSTRRHLSEEEWNSIPLFMLTRALSCIGWIMDRMDLSGSRDRLVKYLELARKTLSE